MPLHDSARPAGQHREARASIWFFASFREFPTPSPTGTAVADQAATSLCVRS